MIFSQNQHGTKKQLLHSHHRWNAKVLYPTWTGWDNTEKHRNNPPPFNHFENIIHFPPFTNENPWASEKRRSISYPTAITRGISFSQTLLVSKVVTTAGRALFRQINASKVLLVSSELVNKKWQLRWGVFSTWGSDCSVTPCWFISRSNELASLCAPMVSLLRSACVVLLYSNPPILSLLEKLLSKVFLGLHL